MNCLLTIVPTRGRPHAAEEFIRQWDEVTGAVADLMFVVDDDDPELPGYREVVPHHKLTVGPHARLGPILNREAAKYVTSYTAVGFMGDDHRPRTMGWDDQVLGQFYDTGVNVVYGNDLFRGADLPTSVFIRGTLVDTLGYFCPPHQWHLYLDDFWLALGRTFGVRYLPDVIIEHVHPAAGKGRWDVRYAEVNHPDVYEHDRVAFEAFMRHVWGEEVARLRDLGYGCDTVAS